jgi:hypothetical protein
MCSRDHYLFFTVGVTAERAWCPSLTLSENHIMIIAGPASTASFKLLALAITATLTRSAPKLRAVNALKPQNFRETRAAEAVPAPRQRCSQVHAAIPAAVLSLEPLVADAAREFATPCRSIMPVQTPQEIQSPDVLCK